MPSEKELSKSKTSTPDDAPLTHCIIVNWNGWADTISCLDSLRKQDYPDLRVVVVDNGSTNDSVQRIKEAHDWITLIEAGQNGGFSAGNNIGIRRALEEGANYVWLLNNDTVVFPHTLPELISKAEHDDGLGQVGSVLHYADAPDRVQAWGGGTINLWTSISKHFYAPVPDDELDYLTAASVLIPAHVLKQVGLLDEGYFMYWEDTDLSFRIRAAGWRIGVAEKATLLHKENASTGGKSAKVDRYISSSGVRFFRKFAPIPLIPIFILIFGRAFRRLIRREWKRSIAVMAGLARSKNSLPF